MLREWGRDSSPNMPPPALCNLRLGAPNRGAVRWLRLFSLTEEMESRIYSQSAIVARVEGVRDRKTWWLFHLRLKGAPWNTSLTSELKRLFWAYKKSWAEIFIEPPRVTHTQIIVWSVCVFFFLSSRVSYLPLAAFLCYFTSSYSCQYKKLHFYFCFEQRSQETLS